MEVKIKIDSKAVDKVFNSLSPKNTDKVLRKGLVVAARTAKKLSVAEIQAHYNMKKKDISVMARVKGPPRSPDESSVTITAQPISLSRFNPSENRKGLRVRVYRGKGSQAIPHAFLAKINGKPSPFVRTKAITPAAAPFVLYPSKKAGFRSPKGAELPINKLLADPASEVIRPSASSISEEAAERAAVEMFVSTQNLLERGKA